MDKILDYNWHWSIHGDLRHHHHNINNKNNDNNFSTHEHNNNNDIITIKTHSNDNDNNIDKNKHNTLNNDHLNNDNNNNSHQHLLVTLSTVLSDLFGLQFHVSRFVFFFVKDLDLDVDSTIKRVSKDRSICCAKLRSVAKIHHI